ncbi:hypothetical protein SAMN05660653_00990 [Desulfonatronum thiosulfatophilum]|uniref:DUF2062 domain-containing protein n=1 Tax=Desulfonatronum thiosulfatophilum TaxID=617002 RepID=A0A1G6BJJ7_9BACT|nr:DUF2062 domain-containing protein [Desulfonatronum thiosulfatophilum]SDB20753.1 hypothetical protein SAMN05660653_00990 [Desulfonatronum thiosulfatophilum]
MKTKPSRLWWENLLRSLRHLYKKVLRIKSTPHDLALGMALGIFIGLLPIIPLQTIFVLILAVAFRCSKLTALIGTSITNPLTIPFFYLLMLRIGRFFLPEGRGRLNPEHWTIGELLQTGWYFYASMLLGGFLIAIPSALFAYFLTLFLTKAHQARRARKMSASPYARFYSPESYDQPPPQTFENSDIKADRHNADASDKFLRSCKSKGSNA